MKKLIGREITDEQFRQVHSRLDVHKQAITELAQMILPGHESTYIHEMLEESKNPFEASDESRE